MHRPISRTTGMTTSTSTICIDNHTTSGTIPRPLYFADDQYNHHHHQYLRPNDDDLTIRGHHLSTTPSVAHDNCV